MLWAAQHFSSASGPSSARDHNAFAPGGSSARSRTTGNSGLRYIGESMTSSKSARATLPRHGDKQASRPANSQAKRPWILVPTLCVGTLVWDALRPVPRQDATQSVADLRSHAERGNEKMGTLEFDSMTRGPGFMAALLVVGHSPAADFEFEIIDDPFFR